AYHVAIAAHHGVEASLCDVGGIVLLLRADFGVDHVGTLKEIGLGRSRHEAGDGDPGVFQLRAQRKGERINERLRAIIDCLVSAGHEAGDRSGDQDASLASRAHVAADSHGWRSKSGIVALHKQLRQRGIDFTILRSAEMNLSPEGAGDMRPTALRKLDLVLGCFHSALRRKEDQTSRYLAGLRNPDIQILGHPQTRVWNRREGLKADWSAVFAEAARLDKAVEIDGYVDRQDLRISLLKVARKEGVRISLGTDAHYPEQLGFMELSLAAAALAKIPAERIINFMSVDQL